MSSIYLYIIYISRPWFKGSAGDGRQRIHIRNVHSLIPLLPLCYSTHKSSFCEEEREYSDGHPSHLLLQLVGKTDAYQRILIKNTPDVVRRPACFVVKGVQGCGFRVVGSGLWVQGCGFRVQGCGGGFAANIYGAMPEGLLIAGFPRIVSLPLEGKVPRRGG